MGIDFGDLLHLPHLAETLFKSVYCFVFCFSSKVNHLENFILLVVPNMPPEGFSCSSYQICRQILPDRSSGAPRKHEFDNTYTCLTNFRNASWSPGAPRKHVFQDSLYVIQGHQSICCQAQFSTAAECLFLSGTLFVCSVRRPRWRNVCVFVLSLGAVELDPLSVVVGEPSARWAVFPVRTSSMLRYIGG